MANRKAEGRPSVVVEHEEWIKELRAVASPGDGGLTVRELSSVWKCCNRVALTRVQRLFDLGRIATGRKDVPKISGGYASVPCYRIIKRA